LWKPFGKQGCVLVFIRHPAAKCSARRNKCRKMRKRHSGRGVLTVWPRFFLIGPLLTTVKAMAFAPAMAFCLITKARDAAKLLSPAKSHVQSPRLSTGDKKNCFWSTWTQKENGEMRPSMSNGW